VKLIVPPAIKSNEAVIVTCEWTEGLPKPTRYRIGKTEGFLQERQVNLFLRNMMKACLCLMTLCSISCDELSCEKPLIHFDILLSIDVNYFMK